MNDLLTKPINKALLGKILEKWLPPETCVKLTMVQHQETSQEKTTALNIVGLDTALGLRNCGAAIPVYLNILEDFCNDAETRLDKMNDALAQENTKLYITLVHALKGAARSIGANETGEKAFWLEKAAARESPDLIRTKTGELKDDVYTLLKNIKTVIYEEETQGIGEDNEMSALRLETLKAALEEMDIEAVNRILLVFAGLSLDKEKKDKISEIEQLVLMFEYERAIEKINEFL
jgi:HPt (histidine-containing phosphotransfer) domain-containing protein